MRTIFIVTLIAAAAPAYAGPMPASSGLSEGGAAAAQDLPNSITVPDTVVIPAGASTTDALAVGFGNLGLIARSNKDLKVDKSSAAISSQIAAIDIEIMKISGLNRRVDDLRQKAEKRVWGTGGMNGDALMKMKTERVSAQIDEFVAEAQAREAALEAVAHEAPPDSSLSGLAVLLRDKVRELAGLTSRLAELAAGAYVELRRLDIAPEGYALKKKAAAADSSAQNKAKAAAHLVRKTSDAAGR